MTTPIFNKNFSDADKELSIKDIEAVHSIRGRIIHLGSILENLIRIVVTKYLYEKHKKSLQIKSSYNHLSFLDNLIIFVEENKHLADIAEFKTKAEKLWNLYRNVFAHGFVYYERFETDTKDGKYKKSKKQPIVVNVELSVLKWLIESYGWTREEITKRLKTSSQNIEKIESGEKK